MVKAVVISLQSVQDIKTADMTGREWLDCLLSFSEGNDECFSAALGQHV